MTPADQQIALRCLNVDKVYSVQRDLRVLRILFDLETRGQVIRALTNISLEVPRGKIVGILGKNGAGKSTLLRVLGGVYQPTRGHVEIHGQVAGLFEMGGMGNPNLTGREYALRYLRIMGTSQKSMSAILEDIHEFSELEEAFDRRIRTYSSGMGARLYFSTATALQHEIYLIDELLSVGDEHFQAKCWQRMRQRLLNGASGVLVTHDWPSILRLCEKTHVIEQGQFSFSGPSDQAVVSYLGLHQAEATIARFSPDNPQSRIVFSGKDEKITFWVDVLQPAKVDFSVSIEILRIGIGWEIVVLADGIPVATKPGKYRLDVAIPHMPLVPGAYSLNVFLSGCLLSAPETKTTFDTRSWTLGNGFELQVEGDASSAALHFPVDVRRLEKVA